MALTGAAKKAYRRDGDIRQVFQVIVDDSYAFEAGTRYSLRFEAIEVFEGKPGELGDKPPQTKETNE